MTPLVYEFLNYLVAVSAAGVSFAVATLFGMAYQRHKTQHTLFRSLGFLFIGEAFGFHLFERSFPELATVAYLFEIIGLFLLYYSLLLNREEGQVFFTEIVFENRPKPVKKFKEFLRFFSTALIVASSFMIIINQATGSSDLVLPGLALIAAIVCSAVVVQKYKRYSISDSSQKKLNLIILIAFLLYDIRFFLSMIYTLPPDVNLPNYEELTSITGNMWLIINLVTFISFVLIAVWQWNFVQKRFFIRLIEVLLTVSIILSVASSGIIGLMGSNIIKDTNLALVKRNGELINHFLQEKLALTGNTANAFSSRVRLIESVQNRDVTTVKSFLSIFSDDLNDTSNFRIYDENGTILFNPYRPNEQGLKVEDEYLTYVIENKVSLATFGIVPGTENILAGRSLSPIVLDDGSILICAINFYFDDKFVKEKKFNTDLDLAIYSNNTLTASTIPELEYNSSITDDEVLNTVFGQGKEMTTTTYIDNTEYFVDYTPVTDKKAKVVGVIVSLRNRDIITDYIRGQLNITFIVITNIAFVVTVISYSILRKGYSKDIEV